jgi:energy-coupling factor transport system permease protein
MMLDPRTKMIMVLCLSSLALIYSDPAQLFLLLLLTLGCLAVFRFHLLAVWGYLKAFLSLMLFLFMLQSVFSPGGKVFLQIGSLPLLSSAGVAAGASVVLRMLVVTASALLLTTFRSRDFVLGLVQWKVPYELAFMVAITLRFLPIFRDELLNVLTAVQLRGVELKKVAWGQKLVLYRELFVPIVYRSMLKAEQMAVAMEARGFRAYPTRTSLRQLNFHGIDFIIMILFLGMTGILIGLHIYAG